MKNPRDAQFIDLAAYRRFGYPKPPQPAPVRSRRIVTCVLSFALGLAAWACFVAFVLWASR